MIGAGADGGSPGPPARETPAIALVACGAFSVQFGAAIATRLFHRVGPAGAVTLRLVIAAAILAVGWPLLRRIVPSIAGSARVTPRGRWDVLVPVGFGLVLAGMNLSFYESIDRIPLGAAVTVEFSGPLALSLLGSRRWLDVLWALSAGGGVALLASLGGGRLDVAGLLLALLAGGFWIGYILLSRQTGRRFPGLGGLSIAMAVAALAVLPFGLADGPGRLLRPAVLGTGAAVAVLSSVVPYTLELIALRRVTARAFGVMLSLDPAFAAAAGALVLGQDLTSVEWVACALVIAANLGNSLAGRAGSVAAVQ